MARWLESLFGGREEAPKTDLALALAEARENRAAEDLKRLNEWRERATRTQTKERNL